MKPSNLETIRTDLFSAIAGNFPVVSASDEFYYFPQVRLPKPDWRVWDRFSPGFIARFIQRLSAFGTSIDSCLSCPDSTENHPLSETLLLKKMVSTLQEQLEQVRTWETHPTLYLTITCLGLAEALASNDPDAPYQRAETLPQFLYRGADNLKNIPVLFRELGLEMVEDTRDYLLMLLPDLPELSSALKALEHFKQTLLSLGTRKDYLLPGDCIARIVEYHMNCGMDIPAINESLDIEINEMTARLDMAVKKKGYDTWQEAYESIPLPMTGKDGLTGLYRDVVKRLGHHCNKTGIVSGDQYRANPVGVKKVPKYLTAIRAASSYSIPPVHPPSGGTFYIFNAHDPKEVSQGYHREYRILTGHETWPGHHLLDTSRWSLASPVLRAVEQPVFYEGWACFAEELLYLTDYLSGFQDRLMLDKRRLWRAIRGKVDLGIQTGTMDMTEVIHYLTSTGMSREQAISSARKYPLNPGYQLCYTVGLQQFIKLYKQFGRNDPGEFSQVVLRQGEIGFNDLVRTLKPLTNR